MNSPHAWQLILACGSCLVCGLVLGWIFGKIGGAADFGPKGNSIFEIRAKLPSDQVVTIFEGDAYFVVTLLFSSGGIQLDPAIEFELFLDGRKQVPPADKSTYTLPSPGLDNSPN